MKTKVLKLIVICMLAGLCAGLTLTTAYAQNAADQAPQLLIKIRDINQLMSDIEKLTPPDQGPAASQQIAMLRGMLQGTDWIDPGRSIVAGMVTGGPETRWIVMIPFLTANPNFQMAYGAIAGEDYYMTAFPPQPGFVLGPGVKEILLNASAAATASDLVVEAAASEFLTVAGPKFAAAIQNRAASQAASGGQTVMNAQETQAMLDNFLATFKQVKTLRLGLDLSDTFFTLQLDIDALPDTFLAGLLTDQGDNTRLAGYQTESPFRFRTRSYNVSGMMQLMGSGLGQVYRQMGLDFEELAEMTKSFTGEMAGGMQLAPSGTVYEMVYVFQPGVDGRAFIADVYLPWFERYNRQMAAFVAQQSGQPLATIYERTADSTVAGTKVIGVKTNFAAMVPPGAENTPLLTDGQQIFETRLAAVGDLMLITSDDARMEKLVATVRGLQDAPAQGPMARFDMDLGTFMADLRNLMPPGTDSTTWPEDLGRLSMQAAMQNGNLTTRTRFNIDDLSKLSAAFSAMVPQQVPRQAAAASAAAPSPAAEASSAPRERPEYWYDRGGLQSAYGAYTAATRSYRKAIELAPRYADAHFQLGVAYGELRQFEAAVKAMTRAIDLEAGQGAYYYGRGRVYLLADEEAQAMRDFMEAGFLGHPDALAYLRDAGVVLE